jgi:putative transposase
VEHAREEYEVSERHACRLLGQWRRTQRYAATPRMDEDALSFNGKLQDECLNGEVFTH